MANGDNRFRNARRRGARVSEFFATGDSFRVPTVYRACVLSLLVVGVVVSRTIRAGSNTFLDAGARLLNKSA